MKRIILCLFVTLIACKTKKNQNSFEFGLSDQERTTSPVNFSFDLTSNNQKETYSVQTNSSFAIGSPLASLNISNYNEAKDLGTKIVDFQANGILTNSSDTTPIPSSCILVGIYTIAKGSGFNKYILFSSLDNTATKGTSDALKISDFEYCYTNDSVVIKIPSKEIATNVFIYFSARGIVLSRLSLGQSSKEFDEALKYAKEREAVSSVLAVPSHVEAAIPRSAADHRAKVQVQNRFEALKESNFGTHLRDNDLHQQVFKELESIGAIPANPKVIGSGSYATVVHIQINGKDYALRRETRDPLIPVDEFRQRVAKERMNYLCHNEFAKKHPGFLETHLAYFTDDESVMIMDFKGGGELHDEIIQGEFNIGKAEKWVSQLDQQMSVYQNGETKISIDGSEYSLLFFHGDIKPQNVMLDSSKQNASFTDFGYSRVILKDKEGKYLQLMADKDGAYKPYELHISANKKEDPGFFNGTPLFCSPEMIRAFNGIYQADGEIAFQILQSIDNYAFNLTYYVTVKRSFPSFIAPSNIGESFASVVREVHSYSNPPPIRTRITPSHLDVSNAFMKENYLKR